MLSEEKLNGIRATIGHTHRKSLKRIAQETEVSKCSARRATKRTAQETEVSKCSARRATQFLKSRRQEQQSTPRNCEIQIIWFIFAFVSTLCRRSKVRSILKW
jgi:response regulator of citrate/malate metabolism